MTKRVVVFADCNACDVPNTEGVETIAFSFAVDNVGYTMDLCNTHAEQYRQAIEPWRARADVGAAPGKKSSAGGPSFGSPPQGGPSTSATGEGLDPKQVREWARSNGYDVPEVGRLNQDIIAAYKSAHGLGVNTPVAAESAPASEQSFDPAPQPVSF
jgi:hypothetical protein